MTNTKSKSQIIIEDTIIIIFAIITILASMFITKKPMADSGSFIGALIILISAFIVILVRTLYPKLILPAFPFALGLGVIISLPYFSFSPFVLEYMNKIDFLSTTPPILAYAGLSIGNSFGIIKQAGWKLVIVAICVFLGTYLLSSLIAQIVLKMQGLI